MRLNSLRLTNFRQHVDTFIEFDVGLTGIIGANGSGKTTILEAIAWALYGQDAARGKKDSIRSLRAGPAARVKVELDFELGGHRYRVERRFYVRRCGRAVGGGNRASSVEHCVANPGARPRVRDRAPMARGAARTRAVAGSPRRTPRRGE